MIYRSGFTLVELIIVTGIFLLLLAIGFVGFGPSFSHTEVSTSSETILSSIKSQQAKAMSGESGGPFGITFGSDYYELMPGNIRTNLSDDISVITSFPNNTLNFESGSGEIVGYQPGQSSITLTSGSFVESLDFNQLGTRIDL